MESIEQYRNESREGFIKKSSKIIFYKTLEKILKKTNNFPKKSMESSGIFLRETLETIIAKLL